MNENLLNYYNTQWKRYTTSSTYINNLFRYLNRYWVKRTAEEGKKDIYEIYTVLFFFSFFFFLFPSLALNPNNISALLGCVEGQLLCFPEDQGHKRCPQHDREGEKW